MFCSIRRFGENDDAQGVTQNIMTGQTAQIGTGIFEIAEIPPSSSKTVRKRILKSRVNNLTRLSGVDMSLEYINPNVWSWHGPRRTQSINAPFLNQKNQSEKNIANSDEYEKPYESGDEPNPLPSNVITHSRKRCYVPTSPKMIISSDSKRAK